MKQVQCCGKVLLSGGYSIIYPNNNGISLAVNAKFHTTFKEGEEKSLIIRSHQFNSEYTYNQNQIHNHKIFDSIIKTLTQYDKFKYGIIEVKNDPQFFGFQSKSGLGSSACLIVSILGLFEQDLKQLFEMSTFANNLSQNKIGSGFDISTAIFGSQLFSRRSIRLIQNDKFKILLIDFNQGQDSVTSAKVVKSYLDENSQVREKFFEISEKASDSLLRFIEGQYSDLKYLKSINIDYRQALKNLGHQCLLDIEPDQSTQILNQLMAEKNIIWALVPGAGGKDAMAALVDKSFNEKNVELIKEKLKLDNIYLLELGESIKFQ